MTEDQRVSRSIFEDLPAEEAAAEAAAPARPRRAWWKVAAVVVLVAAVSGVLAWKGRNGPSAAGQPAAVASEPESGLAFDAETVVATVNGEQITLAQLDEALRALPDQYRGMFERSKHVLLDDLIGRKLLLQEAQRQGLAAGEPDGSPLPSASAEREAVQELLRREVLDGLDVSEAEVRQFYEEHKDEMPAGRSFEDLKEPLRAYALQEKRNEAVLSYLARLRAEGAVTRNEEWIEAQKAMAADNPLDRALATGRPVVADFGQGTCVPCKMMKPILDDLKEDYAGRAEILIIETGEYPAVTQRVGIRAIPTQIFYDAEGNEVDRHQGFMPRDAIVEKLREMGVER